MPEAQPVTLAEDRSIAVPPGAIVKTGYVETHRIRMTCRADGRDDASARGVGRARVKA